MTHSIKHISITRRNQEEYLRSELRARVPPIESIETGPGVIGIYGVSTEELAQFPLFFSAQLLPDAEPIRASSVKDWASEICARLIATWQDNTPPWVLHLFDPATAESGKQYSRPSLIMRETITLLKQKRRSLLRAMQEKLTPECTLVQVALVSPDQGYSSFASPEIRARCGAAISNHIAGHITIPDDLRPPSRAFKKLREAFSVFNLSAAPHSTAVDLGASPGGWTSVLRDMGVVVTAIDRSPLEGSVAHDRKVTFIRGNAFSWTPPEPVDWLVCDVITTPERTFEILRAWVGARLCRNFCVTIKCKGTPDFSAIQAIASYLKQHAAWCDGRQLTHNKNEVTVVGRL